MNEHSIFLRRQKDATELQYGVDNKDPNLDKYGNNWYCETCPYKKRCSAYKERFESGISANLEVEDLLAQLRQQFSRS